MQTRTRVWRLSLSRIGAVALLAALVGCTVHVVSDYDEQIDSGLSQLNTELTAFVNTMIENAGEPGGSYDSNRDFYTNQSARLDTLILRAEAHKALDNCPTSELIAGAVRAALPASAGSSAPSMLPVPDVSTVLGQIKKGDCSVVLLTLVKQGLGQLKTFHKAQGSKGIPPDAHDPILVGGVGSLIRAAMLVEMAKKTGNSIGGQNGP